MDSGRVRTTDRSITDGAANLISRVEELAYELTIGEVMAKKLKTIAPGTKMGDVMELFRQNRVSGAPVVSNGDLIGIVSLEDLIRALREGNKAAQYLKGKLGIGFGETTPDGRFTLIETECLGACGDAPVLLVNNKRMCSFMSADRLDALLDELKKD